MRFRRGTALVAAIVLLVLMAACASRSEPGAGSGGEATAASTEDVTLVIGAYSVVKDAFAELLPAFQQQWREKTGQLVTFQESYEASGTQARSIVGGFEADVAVLAMETDIDKIEKAGLITHSWRDANAYGGMVTRSLVVMGTRQGNPLGIRDWSDLTKEGVKVLYPNPKTSGGAMWDINAIYGAGLKRSEEELGRKDPAYAKSFLAAVHDNVESLDKSGRASMAAFEYGVGDVIVTYENELLARIAQGVPYEIVTPRDTIQIENPAAVIDANADRHGTREVAEAFVSFLGTPEAQRTLAKYGFRPVDPGVWAETKDRFPQPEGLFDIGYLGGWAQVREELYSKKGIWYQVLAGL
ncbi:sulfate ABC transporter substrate-binding protein [Paenibacillus darwinianus]|uniref:Sulfate ABC transporter substrate-binding protein n=2 Tax=Paenibacillus darwinianus TaxID=1380763 RepID=A0A9W5S1V9_9BACL|nr:sulfate ABC transporter substrate-binding protein [Paenibacillus darwinianus]EXX89871.1 sulfate ABC transporter substrate-binding protein [Paenibacillus darwinianus]EXX90127.1 sulfate ABC transporter substrate-binding protein [Paenibacillus darwinianus]